MNNAVSQPPMLSCDKHDYLEIVCMFHYELQVTEKSGRVYTGKARDVKIVEEQTEALVLQDFESETFIATNQIASIDVLTPNARFKTICF